MAGLRNLLRIVWRYLREVSGENDYARYRARAFRHDAKPMSPGEFYLRQLRHKYSRINRCC